MKLTDLIGNAPVAALIGMCKNAGKTTVLSRLVRECAALNRPAALTSIGRDGERTDLVTGTEKPPIYMYQGMLAATAAELLPLSDVSREILDVTDLYTPLGRVVVFRARSDGYVQLAGPSIVSQMTELSGRLRALGAETVLIDGALNRRSPAAGALNGVCILCTGASLDRDMETVVSETAFACRVLTLPEMAVPGEALDRFTIFRGAEAVGTGDVETACAALKRAPGDMLLLSGALTEAAGRALLRSGAHLEGLRLMAEDSSRILLKKESFESLSARGVRFCVRRGTRLAAVTVNPVSAGGWRFDQAEFLEKMRKAAPVPVLDVGRYDRAVEF